MDRRTTLATLLGKRKSINKSTATTTVSGLNPYTGTFGLEEAAHLLRRTTFSTKYTDIKDAAQNGLEATISQLLADKPLPDAPVNYFFEEDPNVPIGETWVNAPYSLTVNFVGYRLRSLVGWTIQNVMNDGISIREKLVLFWHNHFVTEGINEAKFVYRYSQLLREYALGNFRAFTKAITIDPLMLRYLNGNQNRREAPNENFSRELLELFTVGKGELAGPGDYTTFTEDDVVEMAKALTGWRDYGYFDITGLPDIGSAFFTGRHDTSTKQLSHRFNNATISDAGDQEYSNLIDTIFQSEHVALFICRKLYRWFVYYDIPEEVEIDVIEPMAQILRDNDFEITPVLEALLSSEHFFDVAQRGCMIKNPMDFIVGMMNQFEVDTTTNVAVNYELGVGIAGFAELQLMAYYGPPNVAGWPAYYQAPGFYQMWINSVSLPQRMAFSAGLVNTGYVIRGERIQIDSLAFVNSLDDPGDPNSVIAEFASILFPQELSEDQKVYLKSVLIPGLPDFEWEIEYFEYVADPTNPDKYIPVATKLRNLLSVMLTMPEYFLM